jgi:hypothetical protein
MANRFGLKKVFRPAIYVLAVNVFVAVWIFFCAEKIIRDTALLFFTVAVLAVFAPAFFWMKPRDGAWWVYDSLVVLFHLLFSSILWLTVSLLDLGWAILTVYFIEIVIAVFFACVIGLDLLVTVLGKIRKRICG